MKINRLISTSVHHLGYPELDYQTRILISIGDNEFNICNPEAKLTYKLPLEEVIKLIKEENNNHV